MSQHITSKEIEQIAQISDSPVQTKVDRNFGLPTGLYAGTVFCYLAFLGIMSTLFINSQLAIPMVVIVGFVILAFGVAGKWAGMKPDNDTRPLSWDQFSHRGIQTLSGPLTVGEASAQVLVLPLLILVWGVAIAVIVALT